MVCRHGLFTFKIFLLVANIKNLLKKENDLWQHLAMYFQEPGKYVCVWGGVPLGEPVTTRSPSVTWVTYLALKASKMQPLNPRPLPILLMKVLFKILVTKLIYSVCATEGYQRRRSKGTQYHQEKSKDVLSDRGMPTPK